MNPSPHNPTVLSRAKIIRWLILLAGLELLVALFALSIGSSGALAWGDLTAWLQGEDLPATTRAILFQARLPRVCFAAITGAALATGGVIFQAVLRNPLADPYVLGISGGAALAATLFMATGVGTIVGAAIGAPLFALLGAGCSLAILLGAQRFSPDGREGLYVLLLTGVIFNAFASALITFIKAIVTAQKAQELLFYLMGTLSVEGMPTATIAACGAVVGATILGLMWFARDLNLLSLGDEDAAALGVETVAVRRWTVGLASVGVAVAVAYTGLIGFVGLVIPHGLRLLLGPDHRLLIPASALGGASFLTACDLVARASFEVFSTTLPVGVITSLIGAPLFVWLLRRTMGGRTP